MGSLTLLQRAIELPINAAISPMEYFQFLRWLMF
jgi:hypothetical protein